MSNQSKISIENISTFDFNLERIKTGLKSEGKILKAESKRLVSRNAISRAGGFAGKRSGRLSKTIVSKMFRNGLGLYVTHKMKNDEARYPFILVAGTEHIKPRSDHIESAFKKRRTAIVAMLRSSFKKTVKIK